MLIVSFAGNGEGPYFCLLDAVCKLAMRDDDDRRREGKRREKGREGGSGEGCQGDVDGAVIFNSWKYTRVSRAKQTPPQARYRSCYCEVYCGVEATMGAAGADTDASTYQLNEREMLVDNGHDSPPFEY